MAHYDILAFVNDLFWIFIFFSLFFFMIDEFFLKKYAELTYLKHYIYIENVWVKVFIFDKIFLSYFIFLRGCFLKVFTPKHVVLNDIYFFLPFSIENFTEIIFERRSREKILKKFKQTKGFVFTYFNFFVFFLSVW